MGNCAIVGICWGDEGKGRMVDYLVPQYGTVVRYQGGNNAGHSIVNDLGEFKLNLIPSGIFHPDKLNLLGAGCVIDIQHLCKEADGLRQRGVCITPENLRISDRAIAVLPISPLEDKLEEQRLGKAHFGSTLRGIAPAYADRAYKKALRMGDLLHDEVLQERLQRLVDWKNQVYVPGYGCTPFSYEELLTLCREYAQKLRPYICDAGELLDGRKRDGILFEAQLGALRDLDYGIYPYTSSSTPLAAYAPVGSGCPWLKVDRVVGVVKAYSTCVGEGPFVGELQGEEAAALREAGHEYGAATGRPRRVAWMDTVAARYGVKVQSATELALTKLDVLDGFDTLPVCVGYELRGRVIHTFPYTADLNDCKPVYVTLPGWKQDTTHVRRFQDLPQAAQNYVLFLEKELNCPIPYVSVGAEREAMILR